MTKSLDDSIGTRKHPSDLKLSRWAIVAAFTAITARLLNSSLDLNPLFLAAIALSPLIPTWLYLRDVIRFVRGMDELQRRIQMEAGFFGAMGALFLATALSQLESLGVLHGHGLGWEGAFASTFFLYLIGSYLSHKRYE